LLFSSESDVIKAYITEILVVVLYGCDEVWHLTLTKEEHKSQVSENLVPRKIFGPEKDK
jgi:hypothetical protein